MRSVSSRTRRTLVTLALSAASLAVVAPPAHAVSPLPITCTAAGSISLTKPLVGPVQWTLFGKGSCQGDLEGTYILDFTGSGTSDTAAICDDTFVVQNLDLTITGTLTNAASAAVKAIVQEWTAPLTTYPFATPFTIKTGTGNPGAGVFFNHIFLNCAGSPVAQFSFGWLT
jgi:hypothetical protein